MAKKYIVGLGTCLWFLGIHALATGTNAVSGPPLMTKWTDEVSTNTHAEYPRPAMARADWLNLSGVWNYGITPRGQTNAEGFTNNILVPFPVESVLSGVERRLFTEEQSIWYRRKFSVPEDWRGQRILLHFEAVNWGTKVWLNGKEIGSHQGGYDRFSFDITDALRLGGEQELVVSVVDPMETGYQPRGKQMLHPREPFFHASSGIWQTVWLEPVPAISVEALKLVPDIDAGVLNMALSVRGETNNVTAEVVALDGGKEVSRAVGGSKTVGVTSKFPFVKFGTKTFDTVIEINDTSGFEPPPLLYKQWLGQFESSQAIDASKLTIYPLNAGGG